MQILARKFKVTYFRFPVSDLDQILLVDAAWGPVQGAGIRAQLSQTVRKLFKHESAFDCLKPFKSYSRKTISGNRENRIFAFGRA